MRTDRTFTMLKPDSVEKGHIGAILEKITASGFRIVAMKLTQMTSDDAKAFYAVHCERPFYRRASRIYDSWSYCCRDS